MGRPLAEAALVARARHGDDAAFAALVKEHQEIAFRTAYVITGSRSDAEEATQDAFYKAYRALARFRSGAPLRPWLLRIVANEARNKRRSRTRRDEAGLRLARQLPRRALRARDGGCARHPAGDGQVEAVPRDGAAPGSGGGR